jgi:hypothetical protein
VTSSQVKWLSEQRWLGVSGRPLVPQTQGEHAPLSVKVTSEGVVTALFTSKSLQIDLVDKRTPYIEAEKLGYFDSIREMNASSHVNRG